MHERHDIDNATAAASMQAASTSVAVVQEEVEVDTRIVETGRVSIRTRLSERQEDVVLPYRRDEIIVERVAVDRPVDVPVGIREEGNVLIIPLHEEVTVVTRQLVLKEELHVRRTTVASQDTVPVTLRRQDVDVQRIPTDVPETAKHS